MPISTFIANCTPYFLINLIACVLLAFLADVIIKRTGARGWPERKIVITAAILLSLYFCVNTVTNQLMNTALTATNPPQSQQTDQPKQSPKNEFLIAVDQLLADPSRINPETKKALFERFADLFPRGDADRLAARAELADLFTCQEAFYEDAIVSVRSQKPEKSPRRELCQEKPGAFFERTELIPDEVAKVDDDTIASIAAGKSLTQNGKEIKVDETFLRQKLDELRRRQNALKILFE